MHMHFQKLVSGKVCSSESFNERLCVSLADEKIQTKNKLRHKRICKTHKFLMAEGKVEKAFCCVMTEKVKVGKFHFEESVEFNKESLVVWKVKQQFD